MDDEEAVLALERTWATAPIRSDLDTVSGVVADDWVGVGPNGQTMDRETLLEMLASRPSPFDKTDYSDIKLWRFDTTAVVSSAFRGVGKELELTQRFMRVYAKRKGRWRCVAAQIIATEPSR